MLDEAREENKESDAQNMRRNRMPPIVATIDLAIYLQY